MKKGLLTLSLFVFLTAPVGAAPVVTLGPAVGNEFLTVDPGSIRVEALGAGQFVDLQLSITIHPFCIRPIDIGLGTTGDGGTMTDQTGVVSNDCGGDTSVFDIRLTGDGLGHAFDIEFIDVDSGAPLFSIPVRLFPGPAPVVTLGPPVSGDFTTVDPGSIRVEGLGAGAAVDLQMSITVHPFCIVPIDVGLAAMGDGGTFSNQTGIVTNGCGGDTSVFDIRLIGDGLIHAFDVVFVDTNANVPLFAVPVELFPDVADTDGDGVSDVSDNCTEIANADQRDTDADSIGNACDPDIASPNDCRVTFADLGALQDAFFSMPGVPQWNADADFNGDDRVNFGDLETMKRAFFGPPGPSASGCN